MGEGAYALAAVMKALPVAAGVVLLALGLVAGSVFGLNDEALFVSPPEVVAQEFVRALADGHVGSARSMLSRDGDRETSNEEIRRISDDLRSRLGRLEDVDASVVERRLDTVFLRARVRGERDTSELTLPAVRELGEWSITRAREVTGLASPRTGAEARR